MPDTVSNDRLHEGRHAVQAAAVRLNFTGDAL